MQRYFWEKNSVLDVFSFYFNLFGNLQKKMTHFSLLQWVQFELRFTNVNNLTRDVLVPNSKSFIVAKFLIVKD